MLMGEDGRFRNGAGCFGRMFRREALGNGTVEALVAVLGCLLCFRRQTQLSAAKRGEALLCQCANVASEADGPLGLRLIGLGGARDQATYKDRHAKCGVILIIVIPTDCPGLLLSSHHCCLCINALNPAPLVLGRLSITIATLDDCQEFNISCGGRNRVAASAPHER